MGWDQEFFRRFWPLVGSAVTAHRGGSEKKDVKSLLRRLRLRPGVRILDVPCGFGRHSIELAQRGFRVTGVDISPALLAQAHRRAAANGVTVDFRRGDMRRLSYRGQFDVVLNLFTSFGYFGDAPDQQVLERFRRALRPGGWLVIHLINRDWVMRHYRPQQRSRMGPYVVTEEGTFDLSSSVITTDWRAERGQQVWHGTSRLRLYSCHELLAMLKQAGFSQVKLLGDMRGRPLTLASRWMVLVARR